MQPALDNRRVPILLHVSVTGYQVNTAVHIDFGYKTLPHPAHFFDVSPTITFSNIMAVLSQMSFPCKLEGETGFKMFLKFYHKGILKFDSGIV